MTHVSTMSGCEPIVPSRLAWFSADRFHQKRQPCRNAKPATAATSTLPAPACRRRRHIHVRRRRRCRTAPHSTLEGAVKTQKGANFLSKHSAVLCLQPECSAPKQSLPTTENTMKYLWFSYPTYRPRATGRKQARSLCHCAHGCHESGGWAGHWWRRSRVGRSQGRQGSRDRKACTPCWRPTDSDGQSAAHTCPARCSASTWCSVMH